MLHWFKKIWCSKVLNFISKKMAARQERLLAAKDVSVRQKFADKAYNNVSLYSIHTLFITQLIYNQIIHVNLARHILKKIVIINTEVIQNLSRSVIISDITCMYISYRIIYGMKFDQLWELTFEDILLCKTWGNRSIILTHIFQYIIMPYVIAAWI